MEVEKFYIEEWMKMMICLYVFDFHLLVEIKHK